VFVQNCDRIRQEPFVDKLHVASTAKDKCHWESVPKLRRNLCGDSNPQLPQPMACRVITYFLCGLSQAFKNALQQQDRNNKTNPQPPNRSVHQMWFPRRPNFSLAVAADHTFSDKWKSPNREPGIEVLRSAYATQFTQS
jgi:hypothetical protein